MTWERLGRVVGGAVMWLSLLVSLFYQRSVALTIMQGLWQTDPSIQARLSDHSYFYPLSCPKGSEQEVSIFMLHLEVFWTKLILNHPTLDSIRCHPVWHHPRPRLTGHHSCDESGHPYYLSICQTWLSIFSLCGLWSDRDWLRCRYWDIVTNPPNFRPNNLFFTVIMTELLSKLKSLKESFQQSFY